MVSSIGGTVQYRGRIIGIINEQNRFSATLVNKRPHPRNQATSHLFQAKSCDKCRVVFTITRAVQRDFFYQGVPIIKPAWLTNKQHQGIDALSISAIMKKNTSATKISPQNNKTMQK